MPSHIVFSPFKLADRLNKKAEKNQIYGQNKTRETRIKIISKSIQQQNKQINKVYIRDSVFLIKFLFQK
jgi:hypothetical protein